MVMKAVGGVMRHVELFKQKVIAGL